MTHARYRRMSWLALAVGLLLMPAASGAQLAAPFTKITTGDLVNIPAWYFTCAWGDYDGDGYLDLFVGASVASNRNYLYHNNRDGTFTLIDDANMPKIPSNQHGAAWGDYDNDGHLDLIVTAGQPEITNNVIYHNNGDGTFSGITDGPIYTQTQTAGFHGPSWGDYDNDGFLDLFIAGHGSYNRLFHNNGDGTFKRILPSDPKIRAATAASAAAGADHARCGGGGGGNLSGYRQVATPGPVEAAAQHPVRAGAATVSLPQAARGDSAVDEAGVLVSDMAASAGRTWVDYDNDGDIDLFVANLYGLPNFLYRNEGKGRFTKVTNSGLSTRVESTAAVCWADYDNDGFADVFLANQKNTSLYHNNRDGTFERVLDSAVVQEKIPSTAIFSSCAWGDYDNDGFIDLLVTTGCYPASPDCIPRYNLLYHNAGDGTFTKVTGGSVVNDPTTQCSGSSWGDYDNDGFLDLLVSQGVFWTDPQTNLLYHNDGNSNGWLNVRLVGSVSNRSAIGAKVRVNAFYRGESRWQVREINGGDGEGNQSNALNAAFGLADATTVDTVRVEWPSGTVQELHNVAPRQFLTITEPVCVGDWNAKAVLTIRKLNTPPGDDTLTFQGTLTLPSPAGPSVNPLVDGVRLAINGLDVTIPGGAFANPPGKGWTVNRSGTTWTYQDKTPAPTGGIYKVVVQDKPAKTRRVVKVTIKGRHGSYPVAANPRMTAWVALAPADAACGGASFASCVFNKSGTALRCN